MNRILRTIAHHFFLRPIPPQDKTPVRDRLCALLRHANDTVPFYKGRYTDFLRECADMQDSEFWTAFRALPTVTKQDLKDRNADFMADGLAGKFDLLGSGMPSLSDIIKHGLIKKDFSVSISTGGTSGIPTYRWLDFTDANVMAQSFLRSFDLNGWKRGQSFVVFYPMRSYFTEAYANNSKVLSRFFGFSMVPFEEVTLESVQRLLAELRKQKASLLVIFPCVLQRVAEIMRANNIAPFEDLAFINVSGEFFLDCSKRFIQDMFPDSDIQSTYGAVEFGEVAHQCGISSFDYEVLNEFAWMEQGPRDNLLVTSLHQYAFPLIRYEIEDKGNVITGSDGKQFLTGLEGKNTDYLTGSDGQRYYTSFFNEMINVINAELNDAIIHFMLRHQGPHMQLHFVLRNPSDEEAIGAIRSGALETCREVFANYQTIEVFFPDHFTHDYTRKFKVVGEGDGLAEVVGGYYKRAANG